MKRFLFVAFAFFTIQVAAQSNDETVVRKILNDQSAAWNRGDIEGFMKGYWENDSLMFIGKSGITYGWTKTLNNYKRNYPDTASMGKLAFTIISAKNLSPEYFHVIGKWRLQRSIGNLEGHFTLLFRKINGQWVIIADHSS
jgi:ketosteroid isomerase-like protein